jgi:hypothetical protein
MVPHDGLGRSFFLASAAICLISRASARAEYGAVRRSMMRKKVLEEKW